MQHTRIEIPVEYTVKITRYVRRRFGIVDIHLRTIAGEAAPVTVEWTPIIREQLGEPDEQGVRQLHPAIDKANRQFRSFDGRFWVPTTSEWKLFDLVRPIDWAGVEGTYMADNHPFRQRPAVNSKPEWDHNPFRRHPDGNALFALLAKRLIDKSADLLVIDGKIFEASLGPLLEFEHVRGQQPTLRYAEGNVSAKRYFWTTADSFSGFEVEDAIEILEPIHGEILVEGNAPVLLTEDIGVDQCSLADIEESAAWAMLRFVSTMPIHMLTLEMAHAIVGLRNAVQAMSPGKEIDFSEVGDTVAGKLTRVDGDTGPLAEHVAAMVNACRHHMKGGYGKYWQTVIARLKPLTKTDSREMDRDALADLEF